MEYWYDLFDVRQKLWKEAKMFEMLRRIQFFFVAAKSVWLRLQIQDDCRQAEWDSITFYFYFSTNFRSKSTYHYKYQHTARYLQQFKTFQDKAYREDKGIAKYSIKMHVLYYQWWLV